MTESNARHEGLTAGTSCIWNDIDNNVCVDLEAETIGAPSQEHHDMCSAPSLRSASNTIDLSQPNVAHSYTVLRTRANHLYTTLTKNVDTYPVLHQYFLADLEPIHRKQTELIARGDTMLLPTSTPLSFPERGRDNSLKHHRSFLENLPSRKKSHVLNVCVVLRLCCER